MVSPGLIAPLIKTGLLLPDNPVQSNASLSSLLRRGLPSLSWTAFSSIHALSLPLCSFSLCSAVAAATSDSSYVAATLAHALSVKSGWLSAVFLGGAILNFYVKAGLVGNARKVFDEMPVKNNTCRNSLLCGYIEAKLYPEGLSLLRTMEPDNYTYSAALRMCAGIPATLLGKEIHGALIRRMDGLDSSIVSSLIEMYGCCGLVKEARKAFDMGRETGTDDVVTWTCLLEAYGNNGEFDAVIREFEEMTAAGTMPDGVAYVAVLSACSKKGDVTSGFDYFRRMREDHGIVPWPEHYGCIVRLLCGSGHVDQAWELVEKILKTSPWPEHCAVKGDLEGKWQRTWGALLVASSESGDVAKGTAAAAMAIGSKPASVGILVELSNLLARRGMWKEIEALREEMNQRLKKEVGCSWLL